jgi:hypothetical protein
MQFIKLFPFGRAMIDKESAKSEKKMAQMVLSKHGTTAAPCDVQSRLILLLDPCLTLASIWRSLTPSAQTKA